MLNVLSYPHPTYGITASSLGQILRFLGYANLIYLNGDVIIITTTNTDEEGVAGLSYASSNLRFFYLIPEGKFQITPMDKAIQ